MSSRQPLAVIGVISASAARREVLRQHWAAVSSSDVRVRFVMSKRDMPKPSPPPGEDDVDLVDCALGQSAGRAVIMLALVDAWWRHAVREYRGIAPLIGRADDDVLVNPSFLSAFLGSTIAHFRGRHGDGLSQSLYVGQFQWYSWDAPLHRPRGWGMGAYNARRAAVRDDGGERRCTMRGHRNRKCRSKCKRLWEGGTAEAKERSSLLPPSACPCYHRHFRSSTTCRGPYPFAIGPLQFLSFDLAEAYAHSSPLAAAVQAALDSRLDRSPTLAVDEARARGRYLPYDEGRPEATHLFEDAFLGYATCTMLHSGAADRSGGRAANLTYVSMPYAPWDVPCHGATATPRARRDCLGAMATHADNWSDASGATAVVHHVGGALGADRGFVAGVEREYVHRAAFRRCRFECSHDARQIWLAAGASVQRRDQALPCGTGQTWCSTICSS